MSVSSRIRLGRPGRVSALASLALLAPIALAACDNDPPPRGDAGSGRDANVAVDSGGGGRDGGRIDTGLRPSGRYAEIWTALGEGEGELGYPLADPLGDVLCAWQPFEGGWMLWVEARSLVEGCTEFCELPRLFSVVWPGGDPTASEGDRYYRHPDQFMEGTGPFFCDEADRTTAEVGGEVKPLGPIRGFGRVWCENAEVMTDLGAALAPERGGPAFLRCASQLFQGGLILHNPNAEDASYWALMTAGNWRRFPE